MSMLKYSSLTFASGSRQKYEEYRALLGIQDIKFSIHQIVEPQKMSIESLAEEKCLMIRAALPDGPFFVEHTGLEIDEWKGLPGGLIGVFMNTVGNSGICEMMRAFKGPRRAARARVVIGYWHLDSGYRPFLGEVVGTIAEEPRGTNGFGWDPIFIPKGSNKTYGEMSLEEKNLTSMRKKAVDSFAVYLDSHFEL